MAADMSAPEAISTDAAFSVGFTMIDADPVTGSIATDSARTKAVIVRTKRIILPSDAAQYRDRGPYRQALRPASEGDFDVSTL
jgi:hypothetical protein